MKRFYFQFRIMLITLALGLASASFFNWLDGYLTEISVDLPKAASGSPIFVFPGDKYMKFGGSGGTCGDTPNPKCESEILVHNRHRRNKTSRK